MNAISKLPLVWRLAMLVSIALVGFLALTTLSSLHTRTDVEELEQKRIRHLVESAGHILSHFHAQEQAGSLTRPEAQARALAALRDIRYDAGSNYIFVYDERAVTLLSPMKPETEGKSMAGKTDQNGVALFDEIARVAQTGKPAFIDYVWPRKTGEAPQRKTSYVEPFKPWGWALGTGIYLESVDQAFADMLQRNLLVTAALAAVVGVFAYLIARGITQQLGGEPAYASDIMRRIADGDQRADVAVKGGADSLLGTLRKMATELRATVSSISQGAADVAGNASAIAAVAREVAAATDRQTDATSSIAAAVEEMTVSINHISDHAGETEQASATSSQLAEDGRRQAIRAADGMKRVSGTVEDATVKIQHLAERASEISGIASVIKEIAAQTNLLALNAAIEAARAGEQGRGFAVVADEVRGLAERTAKATVQIEDMIKGVSGETAEAVNAMARVSQQVADGVSLVEGAADSLEQINSATENSLQNIRDVADSTREQSGASTAIAQQVEQIALMCEGTHRSMVQTLSSMEALDRLSASLRQTTERFAI
ncbi:MAG: methyl-accepting chemotaxis protein [Rhodocyclaceae bacterium]|nr:methyl-accepting chemotaxis protein [Rhodocyclaceae bacterium]